jgi:hypothetical protein
VKQERPLPLKIYNLMHNRGAHNGCFANSAKRSSQSQHETALHSVEIVEKLNNINRDLIRFSFASLVCQYNKARNFLQTATIKGNGKNF